MLKVDIIYGGDVYAPNGASVLMRKIDEAQDLFAKKGVEHSLISPSKGGKHGGSDEVSTQRPSVLKKIIRKLSKYSLLISWLRYRRNLISPANRALDLYEKKNQKGDVVVFHETWTCYEYLKRNKGQKNKVILIIHGDGDSLFVDMPRFDSVFLSSYKRKIKEAFLNNCYKIGFDADYPRRHFCNKFDFDESKSFYVYNGIDVRPCPQFVESKKLKIICVASLSDRKNQKGILNAVGQLDHKEQKAIEIILVGEGPIRESLEDIAQNLTATVSFAGTMSENQYYKLLKEANCFCLYSKSEGLPIAVIEGMRAGLPVVGSCVAGIPEEIVDGVTGFVVDLKESELANKIKWMITNLNKLPEMGRRSYELFLEKFTTEAMINKYVEIYNS